MSAFTGQLKRNQMESMKARSAGPTTPSTASAAGFGDRKPFKDACMLPASRIVPDPDQPRKTFAAESIARTAQSLTAVGQLVPIIVRYDRANDRYIIVDGERRHRAATLAGLADLSCVVESEANRETILEIQLVVNALREDVNPMEQARAWQRLAESRKMSLRDLAKMLNYDHTVIGRKISLLDLPEDIQTAIENKAISQETGIGLAQIADPVKQAELAAQAKENDLPRGELREVVKASKAGKPTATGNAGTGKVKPPIARTFKFPGGLRIEATRAKGLDPLTLVEAPRSAPAEVEAELPQAG